MNAASNTSDGLTATISVEKKIQTRRTETPQLSRHKLQEDTQTSREKRDHRLSHALDNRLGNGASCSEVK